MAIRIEDNRTQAEKDKQAEKRAIRADIAKINEAIEGLADKTVFDALNANQKWDIVRKGLLVGLRAVKWLLRNSL